jgi:hypothetical protein
MPSALAIRLTVVGTLFATVALLALSASAAATVPRTAAVAGTPNHLWGPSASTQYRSFNWAGYFAYGKDGSVSKAAGAWVQPGVSCPSTGSLFAAFWVGMDGAINSSTVEQTGTLAQCTNGKASYVAWWELYPLNAIQPISGITVHPGDSFTASVTHASSGFTMTIKDVTTGKSFSKTATESGTTRNSAECIAERPSVGGHLANLADFGKMTFSSCTAKISGTSGGIGTFAHVGEITMVDSKRKILAQPSGLTSNTAFTVTWKASS